MSVRKFSRRDFLKLSGAAVAANVLSACGQKIETEAPPTTTALASTPTPTPTPIITPTVIKSACPEPSKLLEMPILEGLRYEALVPDTLDLQEMSELVLGTMTSCVDPQDNFAPFDRFSLWRNPPVMYGKTQFNGKYMEATALLRYLTGSDLNQHVDKHWRRTFLEHVIRDEWGWWGIDSGRLLAWLGNYYRIEHNECWRELGEKAAANLAQSMKIVDDYGFCAGRGETDGTCPAPAGEMPTGWGGATYQGWTLQGLAQLYKATQSSTVLEIAGKLARYLKDHAQIFDGEGHFLAHHPSENGPRLQFHHNGNAMVGLAEYAAATGDAEINAFVKSSYEWILTLGSPLVGFFPEYILDPSEGVSYPVSETCCVADMIQLALLLSETGQGDYWDDVDRFVRNQFAEMQLSRGDWIDTMVAGMPVQPVEPDTDGERVSERIVGAFASWATANDWYGFDDAEGSTFCCIGNGGRALYYVWDKMLTMEGDTLKLHLLFNRASAWADVNSYIPYEGRVDVSMKTVANLAIRLPEWVKPKEAVCTVNEALREYVMEGRYIQVGQVNTGDKVTLTFPIAERAEKTTIGQIDCTLTIKGNDVVAIDPPGKYYPLYQRARFRQSEANWVTRQRFVAKG